MIKVNEWSKFIDIPEGSIFSFAGPLGTEYKKIDYVRYREFCSEERHLHQIADADLGELVYLLKIPGDLTCNNGHELHIDS